MIISFRRHLQTVTSLLLCASLAGCGTASSVNDTEPQAGTESETETDVSSGLSKLDAKAWSYNADDDVYYQLGVSYCETPADASYETLAVFVPGAYMSGTDNGDGTYTCVVSESAEVNGYTAETAPIVMPINTPGYSAQAALSEYSSVSEYTDKGFIYVHAGCRGRDDGAPAGVTDLKAAVRFVRYSAETIPGNMNAIYTFGMSGGGAQSALMGATGDSALYEPYLLAIGAVQGVSDAVAGSMCWCPITSLDTADEAYEWMLGVSRANLTEEEQAVSDELAKAYAAWLNEAGIKDENGNVLTLEESDEGIYQAGSYYDFIKRTIETSLNHFLSDTTFPYEASASNGGGMPGGNGDQMHDGEKPEGMGDGERRENGAPAGENGEQQSGEVNFEAIDNIARNDTGSAGLSLSGTYETAQDYIDALNANGEWVSYDADTNTASITDIASFVKNLKNASKNLGAFDQLDRGQGENTLFGYGDGEGAHFDETLAEILSLLGSEYAADYESDLAKTDSLGSTVETRLNMYSPLYYLLESADGYGKSTVAKNWRIRTGINQGDCALSTEVNLALALENCAGVETVDFETVWGLGHTQAERTGSSADNFIAWVESCTK